MKTLEISRHRRIGPMAEPIVHEIQPPAGVVWIDELCCLECGLALANVYSRARKTVLLAPALRSGGIHYIYRDQIACPKCGAERSFYSVPMSAIRLGLVGASGE